MKIVKAGFDVLTKIDGMEVLKAIEVAGRTCYKSEDKITNTSAIGFVQRLIAKGHEAMIEHQNLSVKVICDRGVSHEIVRHRIASYAQESTRYCDYAKDKSGDAHITFIKPEWVEENLIGTHLIKWDGLYGSCNKEPTEEATKWWFWHMALAERDYFRLRDYKWKPEQARSVLPNSLKTELIVTMNLREWRHFFKLRTAKAAHPQIREIAIPLLQEFKKMIPIVFDDIEVQCCGDKVSTAKYPKG